MILWKFSSHEDDSRVAQWASTYHEPQRFAGGGFERQKFRKPANLVEQIKTNVYVSGQSGLKPVKTGCKLNSARTHQLVRDVQNVPAQDCLASLQS